MDFPFSNFELQRFFRSLRYDHSSLAELTLFLG